MDVGDRDKVEETDKGNGASVNYHLLMGMIPHSDLVGTPSLISMVNSFGPAPALWDHPANSQSVGFNGVNDHSGITTFEKLGLTRVPGSFGAGLETGWEAPKAGVFIPTGPGFNPHSIAHFPADSAFIERAARFSCFSTGNIADMVNPFGMNHTGNAYHQSPTPHNPHAVFGPSASKEGSPKKLDKKNGGYDDDAKSQEELSLIDAGAEPSSAKGLGSKKRKRGGQDTEAEQSGEGVEDNGTQNPEALPSSKANGENGKQSSQASDPPKEGYIHVRARRGQATNSHSLAERVRREKISERMKFLQDLVPGCSKVTGKAVMLDEIINYVQSLQRQVEFLSMKLATVNPRLDFNIESLLAKEQMLAARAGPPLGFSPDMSTVYPQLHPSQPTINQPGLPVIGSSSDALGNINPQMTSVSDGYNKEPTPQMHLWDGELHNIVQMGFSSNTSSDNQDTSSPLPPSHTKVEL